MSQLKPEDQPQQLKRATASTLRALSGAVNSDVSYHTGALALQPWRSRIARQALSNHQGGDHAPVQVTVPLPNINEGAGIDTMRGAGDSGALFLRHHDAQLHKRNQPKIAVDQTLFDLLEQVRCEAIATSYMAGVRSNISAMLEAHCVARDYANSAKSVAVPMEEGIALIAARELAGLELGPASQVAAGEWQEWLVRRDVQWQDLRAVLDRQNDFAALSRAIIDQLNDRIPQDGAKGSPPDADQTMQDGRQDEEGDDHETTQQQAAQQNAGEAMDQAGQTEQTIGMADGDEDSVEGEDGQGHDEAQAEYKPHTPAPLDEQNKGYTPYTNEFDTIIEAKALADEAELARLRALLDNQLEPYQTLITRMANRLQRLLMARQQRSWLFDQDDGWLDTRRLARIITNPNTPTSYKREKETDFRDSCVTLLIDNSGSMRGRPITVAALTTDILARTLERCGLKVEILGFTTATWKGGQSRQKWMSADRPEHPGRLNDLRHIIYKNADTPWRRSRLNLGLMLKEGVLKENIDGEALQWAAKRLSQRPEERKILMVISDGAPVDDSTLSANASDILEAHLCTVIDRLENHSRISLLAIGIGHDVSRYYARAVTIRDSAELGEVMVNQLSDLFV